MHRRNTAMLTLAMTITVGGWALGSWSASSEPAGDLLVIDEAGTVQLLDVDAGERTYELPNAVVAPDRSTLFTTAAGPGSTHVESRDARTGEITGVTSVVGEKEIRVVSPDAGALALMEPREDAAGLYEPVPRSSTTITVAYTDERAAQTYELDGNYEPETFSVDEGTLYLLDFQPADAPEYYFVRELDLATGAIVGVKTPQVDLRPEMRGVAREQRVAPAADQLYTLYSIPGDQDPVHDVAATGETERWAFVHVLDLAAGIDFCIFLPTPMGEVNEAAVGLGLSPDGSTLWVVDPSTAMAAKISTADLAVVEVYQLPQIAHQSARARVAAADDGTLYVAVGASVREFAPGTMELTGAWDSRDESGRGVALVDAVQVSLDGAQLRYSAEGTIVIIDRLSQGEVASLRGPDGEGLVLLGPPTGTAVQIPLDCAC